MTVSSTTRKTALNVGNGVTTSFAFTFKVQSSADIVVYRLEDGVQDEVDTADYTVSLNANQNTNPGGSVLFDTAPTSAQSFIISTDADATQELNIQNQATFNPATVMEALDKLTIQSQQLRQWLTRSVSLPLTDGLTAELSGAEDRKGKILGFNATTGAPEAVEIGDFATSADLSSATVLADGAEDPFHLYDVRDWYSVEEFGAVGNGTTDDADAIQRAINAAFTNGRREVRFGNKLYAIGTTLTLGDGSTTAYSTKNNLMLSGFGTQFMRLSNSGSPLEDIGTRFKWIGSAGSDMVKLLGPAMGLGIRNIGFNGNALAARCLYTVSVNRSRFANLSFDNYTSIGWENYTVAKSVISGSTGETDQNCDNIAENIHIVVPQNCEGFRNDGFLGSATAGEENGGDGVRWLWKRIYAILHRTGGVVWHWKFADQHTVLNYHCTATNTNDGNSCSVKMTRSVTVPGGYVYPANITYCGDIDHGQGIPPLVIVDASDQGIGQGNNIGDFTTDDTQPPMTWPATKSARATVRSSGVYPQGGHVVEQGPWAGKCGHNALLNSRFLVQTDGTSGAAVPSGTYMADQFFLSYDGTATVGWSIVEVSPGFTTDDGTPRYALQVSYVPGSGNSYCRIVQPVQVPGIGAEMFNGSKATLRALLKQTAGTAIALTDVRCEQHFGTGGSPSGTVTTTVTTPVAPSSASLTSSFKRLDYVVSVPSTAGKARGSNQDDYVNLAWTFPVANSWTIQFMLPQFALGNGAAPFDQRSAAQDEYECLRFARNIGAGLQGAWANSASLTLAFPLNPPMRGTPTATISTVTTSSTVTSPGTGTFTVNGLASTTVADPKGMVVSVNGATGATAKEQGLVHSNLLKISARI